MEWKDIVKQKDFKNVEEVRDFFSQQKLSQADFSVGMSYFGKVRKYKNDEYIKNIENRLNQLYKDLEVIEGQEVLDGNLPKEIVDKLNLLIYAQLELQNLSNSLTRGKPLRD